MTTPIGPGEPASGLAGSGFKKEIQALRAIAVLIVLVFHVWPDSLPGGYVGVDVFFVISGYLITGILFKQFSVTGSIDLKHFYVRRIRRLLPAAAVVLIAVAILLPLLPQTQWEENVGGIVASTLYFQNWWLASQAVDYLAAESAPSAVMHFWSLSVEEQYYIGWPILLALLGALPVAWRSSPGRIFAALVFAVVLLSFGYSVWLTAHNPSLAYFSTLTRAWELGIGGLLAVTTSWRALPLGWREAAAWLGLGMIVAAAIGFNEATAFPGYAAALPVLGTALVLIGGESPRWFSAYNVLRRGPFQYFGDISYSLYLWHWPVIIFFSAVASRPPGLVDGAALIVVSTALAHQSKALVEDQFRAGGARTRGATGAFGIAAGSIVVCLIAAWAAPRPWLANGAAAAEGQRSMSSEATPIAHPGALALTNGTPSSDDAAVVPSLESARDDVPAPYRDKCMSRGTSTELTLCEYGDRRGEYRVLLVGDTQAAQWQPALTEIAIANSWALDVAVKTQCILGEAIPARDGKRFSSCEVWREKLIRHINSNKPDLVLVAQSPSPSLLGGETGGERTEILAKSLAQFGTTIRSATQVAFVRSAPNLRERCTDQEDLEGCGRARSSAVSDRDPVVEASKILEGAVLMDLTDAICAQSRCEAVVGNVAVYRTPGHLTATYSRSMAHVLSTRLGEVLGIEVAPPEPDSIPRYTNVTQRALAAKRDNPDYFSAGCHVNQVDAVPKHCLYGVEGSETKVVLVGDSHAGQWLPAVQEIAMKRQWRLYSYTKSACAFSDATVKIRGREYTSCTAWNDAVMDEIKQLGPDVVITSQSRGHTAFGSNSSADSERKLAEGLASRWKALRDLGIRVVVIADTPWMEESVPDCLSRPRAAVEDCATPAAIANRIPDSILLASDSLAEITLVDMNSEICSEDVCPAIKDDMVVWRDRHHLTATFARSLASHLDAAISSDSPNVYKNAGE